MPLGQRAGRLKTNNEQEEEQEGEEEQEAKEKLTLANLVVWFRAFITVLDDAAVGAGGEGSWGSRPPRLLRVIEQRAGCAHEAAQLFVSLCRGLGLRARYVACLDPVPPSPFLPDDPPKPSKQTRNNTVDLTTCAGGHRGRRKRRMGRGASGGGEVAERGGSASPQAWAEVLCRDDGKELVRRGGGARGRLVLWCCTQGVWRVGYVRKPFCLRAPGGLGLENEGRNTTFWTERMLVHTEDSTLLSHLLPLPPPHNNNHIHQASTLLQVVCCQDSSLYTNNDADQTQHAKTTSLSPGGLSFVHLPVPVRRC